MLKKWTSLGIIRRFLKEELQSNQVKIAFRIHKLIVWKMNPFVPSVTCTQCQTAFKWTVNFWLQLFSIQRDGKYFNGWNFYLHILQIQENRAGRNFIMNCVCIYCSLRKQKCRLKTTTTNGWRHFGQSEQCKSSVLLPIQSERSPDSGFFACDLRKDCIMPSSQKQITELKGESMITGLPLLCFDYQSTDSTCACIYVPRIWIANKLPNCILQNNSAYCAIF